MTIDEMIAQLADELTISLLKDDQINEALADWLYFLITANESHLVSIYGNYVFAQFNEEDIPFEKLLEMNKITANVGYLMMNKETELNEDTMKQFEGVDTIVMYDIVNNVGYPVVAMKVPVKYMDKLDAVKAYIIKNYEEAGLTTDVLVIETD